MTNKEYLRQLRSLQREIQELAQEQKDLQDLATAIGSTTVTGPRVKTSPKQEARYVELILKVAELQRKIVIRADEMVRLREKIIAAIDRMSRTEEQMVLKYRYLHMYTWEAIAEAMHASRATVIRWHGSALLHFKQR